MRQLHSYQVEAKDFLAANPMAALFMDMGLGKTAPVVHEIARDPTGGTLLVGPIRVIETVWEREAKQWPASENLSFSLVRGSPAVRRRALEASADVYLVNPEILPEALEARRYKRLVIDESSMFKNPSTKRFKILRKHLPNFERRVILTGTPTPNSLMEIWPQVFILDRGERLETAFYRFKSRYFEQVDYQGFKFEPRQGAVERVTDLMKDLVFRVDADGILAERPVIRNPVQFNLPAEARRTYDTMARHAFLELLSSEVTAINAAASLMKLRQIASGFVYDDDHGTVRVHDLKLDATAEILDQTPTPVIVVYNFQHELAALRERFPQGVCLDEWDQDRWDAGKIPLLFLHPASGGHGLNLQYGSHTMIIFSASFSYEQMAQTMARIDRQGQKHLVMFHLLEALDTVDELVLQVLESKAQNQATVLDLVKGYARAQIDSR